MKMIREIFVRAGVQDGHQTELEIDFGAKIFAHDRESPSFTAQFGLKIRPSASMGTLLDLLLVHLRAIGCFTESEILLKFHTWVFEDSVMYVKKTVSLASRMSKESVDMVNANTLRLQNQAQQRQQQAPAPANSAAAPTLDGKRQRREDRKGDN